MARGAAAFSQINITAKKLIQTRDEDFKNAANDHFYLVQPYGTGLSTSTPSHHRQHLIYNRIASFCKTSHKMK